MAGPWERYQEKDSSGKWTKEKSSKSFSNLAERYGSPQTGSKEGPWNKYRNPRLTESMARGFFSGTAEALGMGTSGINWLMQQAGYGVEEPFGGSTHLRRGLQSVGHGYTAEDFEKVVPEAQRPFARGMETVGEAAPYIAAPFGMAVRGGKAAITAGKTMPILTPGTSQAPAMVQPAGLVSAIIQSAKTQPQQYLTIESLLAGSSGSLAGVAEYFAPGDPTIRFLGELGGGLMPTTWLARSSGLLTSQIRNIRAKMNEEGRLDAAAELIQKEMKVYQGGDDFDEAVGKALRNLDKDQLPGEQIFAGELSQHPVLIALQNKVVKDNPQLSQKLKDAAHKTNMALKHAFQAAYKGGNKDIIRELGFWQQRFLLDTLAQTNERIVTRAKSRLERIKSGRTKEGISNQLKKQLGFAYRWGRAGERLVWRAVPNDVQATNPEQLQPILDRYNNLLDEGVILREDIPPYVSNMIQRIERFITQHGDRVTTETARQEAPALAREADAFLAARGRAEQPQQGTPEIITSGDLKLLRSRIGRFGRATRDSDKSISYSMNELSNSILSSFERLDLGEPLSDALAYSRQFNNLFTKDEVGKLLGYTVKGESKVKPGLTGQAVLGPDGTDALLASKATERATQLQRLPPRGRGRPLTGQEVSRSIMRSRARSTTETREDFLKVMITELDPNNTGIVDPGILTAFKKKYAETLRLHPRLRQEFNDAKSAQETLKRAQKEILKIEEEITKKSLFARITGYQDGAEAIGNAVLKSKTPTESYLELITSAKKHGKEFGNTDAIEGLRQSTMDWIFRNSMRNDMLSAQDVNEILKMKPDNKTPSLRELMAEHDVLDAEQLKNLEIVMNRLEEVERGKDVSERLGLYVENPGMLADLLARLLGANLAGSSMVAQNTGSSLLMAAAGSRYMRDILNKLPMETMHEIITDAVTTDKELLKLLLKRKVTPKDYNVLERKLEAWLLSAGTRYITEEEKKPTTKTRTSFTGFLNN